MGEELRRTFLKKFGRSIINKHRPTATTSVPVYPMVALYLNSNIRIPVVIEGFGRVQLFVGGALRLPRLVCKNVNGSRFYKLFSAGLPRATPYFKTCSVGWHSGF